MLNARKSLLTDIKSFFIHYLLHFYFDFYLKKYNVYQNNIDLFKFFYYYANKYVVDIFSDKYTKIRNFSEKNFNSKSIQQFHYKFNEIFIAIFKLLISILSNRMYEYILCKFIIFVQYC